MIILLTTLILGIAISAMILSFKDTAQSLTEETKDRLQTYFEEQ